MYMNSTVKNLHRKSYAILTTTGTAVLNFANCMCVCVCVCVCVWVWVGVCGCVPSLLFNSKFLFFRLCNYCILHKQMTAINFNYFRSSDPRNIADQE